MKIRNDAQFRLAQKELIRLDEIVKKSSPGNKDIISYREELLKQINNYKESK